VETDGRARPMAVGVSLALGTALISGVAVFLNSQAVRQFPDATLFTTLKNGVAAVVLLSAAAAIGGMPRQLGSRRWLGLLTLGLVGGSLPFVLFFNGLAGASAPAAAVIHKTLFIWVALLAVVFLGERPGAWALGALGVLLVAQLLIQPPSGLSWGGGESLIALATGLWAIETILARRLLSSLPALTAGAARMGFGLIILVCYLAISGRLGLIATLGAAQWAWVLGTGLLLAGYVATWYSALQRAPATVVTAVLTLGAPITAALQAVASGTIPAPLPLTGQLVILAAASGMAAWFLRAPRLRGHPAGDINGDQGGA